MPDPRLDVVSQQTPIQLRSTHAQISLLDPSGGVLPQRHPPGKRIEPVAPGDVGLCLGQELFGVAFRTKVVGAALS
jgi:hypothetical protein